MKRKNSLYIAGLTIIVGAFVAFNLIAASSSLDTAKIKDSMKEKGFNIEQLQVSEQKLNIKLMSKASKKVAEDDILALREIRNEVRKDKDKTVKSIDATIVGADGQDIYHGIDNDIDAIPDFVKLPVEKLDSKQTESELSNVLSAKGVQISLLRVANGELGGKFLDLNVQFTDSDLTNANELIKNIQAVIDELNTTIGTGIYQYNLKVEDGNKKTLILLTSDLIYRDFLWWQTPDLGSETWTGHSPQASQN